MIKILKSNNGDVNYQEFVQLKKGVLVIFWPLVFFFPFRVKKGKQDFWPKYIVFFFFKSYVFIIFGKVIRKKKIKC